MVKPSTPKPPGKKAPFGTTKGAFGNKDGKGGKGKSKGKAKPLAKMDCGQPRTKRGGEAVFDDKIRKEWVTGYSKRKTKRRNFAISEEKEKARKERLVDRKERREELKRTLGITGEEEEEVEEKVAGVVDTEVVEYGSGVTVTVEGID